MMLDVGMDRFPAPAPGCRRGLICLRPGDTAVSYTHLKSRAADTGALAAVAASLADYNLVTQEKSVTLPPSTRICSSHCA